MNSSGIDSDLCEKFPLYFHSKTLHIRNELDDQNNEICQETNSYKGNKLVAFETVSSETILKTIKACTNKTCDLDPMPTELLKSCIEIPCFLDCVTKILNQSLQCGAVPDAFKTALLTPLLKKPNLDEHDLKNFRPVSNLPFCLRY